MKEVPKDLIPDMDLEDVFRHLVWWKFGQACLDLDSIIEEDEIDENELRLGLLTIINAGEQAGAFVGTLEKWGIPFEKLREIPYWVLLEAESRSKARDDAINLSDN